jgi:hypothetical protein
MSLRRDYEREKESLAEGTIDNLERLPRDSGATTPTMDTSHHQDVLMSAPPQEEQEQLRHHGPSWAAAEGLRRVRCHAVERQMRYLTFMAALGGFLFGYDTGTSRHVGMKYSMSIYGRVFGGVKKNCTLENQNDGEGFLSSSSSLTSSVCGRCN